MEDITLYHGGGETTKIDV